MKIVSEMGRFLVTIKLKNEADHCGTCHLFMNGTHSAANTSQALTFLTNLLIIGRKVAFWGEERA